MFSSSARRERISRPGTGHGTGKRTGSIWSPHPVTSSHSPGHELHAGSWTVWPISKWKGQKQLNCGRRENKTDPFTYWRHVSGLIMCVCDSVLIWCNNLFWWHRPALLHSPTGHLQQKQTDSHVSVSFGNHHGSKVGWGRRFLLTWSVKRAIVMFSQD